MSTETTKKVEPKQIPNPLGFGPIIGKSGPLSVPVQGSYKGSGEFSQDELITRERTSSSSIKSRTVIELLEDGKMTACFAGSKIDLSSVSKYASHDGEHHNYDHTKKWLMGARGTWSIVNGKANLLLTEVRQGTCIPDVPQTGFELPFELSCVLVGPGEKLPGQIMACHLVKEPGWLGPAGLDLGMANKVGPWSLRFTNPRTSLEGAENGPWILLGRGEGLHVKSKEGRRDALPRLILTKGALELIEDDWKYKGI